MACVVGFVGRGGKIMFCVRVAEVAARFALYVTARIELMASILRTFVKSNGNAGASGVRAFCVAVTFKIYLLDFFNPGMLVSAGYLRNSNGNIASLPVRRRYALSRAFSPLQGASAGAAHLRPAAVP